jgi:ABC-2 type transport system ATP-binding protein
MTVEDVIVTRGLTKYFGELCAVDHVDFTVKRGEVFGFLGPNGAGKTTTIRMLVGLTIPTEGTAYINDLDIRRDIVRIKQSMGVVPDKSNLYDELTALKNLQFMAGLYHVPKGVREERARELLETFGLWDRRSTRFGRLSSGLKRRLTIAAALIHNPNVLFFDEPTTGLDVMSARSLRGLLRDLKETGVTTFLTTHYIEEADQLCERIAIIVKGKVVTIDTPQNLKSRFQSVPTIEVTFSSQIKSLSLGNLEAIEQVKVADNRMRGQTKNVSQAVRELTAFAQEHDLEILHVNTINPSLEDAFIRLTGLESETMLVEKERRGGRG